MFFGKHNPTVAVTGVRRCRYIGPPKTRLAYVFAAALDLIHPGAWWNGTAPGQRSTGHLTGLDLAAQPNWATECRGMSGDLVNECRHVA